MGVKARIVKIGNSRGVRLPKVILEQSGIGEEVELVAEPNCVIIRSADLPRKGWEDQFEEMARLGDDRLLDQNAGQATQWDEREWKW